VRIISAVNFPVAVWSWNAAPALIAGNAIIRNPSEKAPLAASAAGSSNLAGAVPQS
jgi:aldehyde dehydrogenase (NAD+)